MAAVPQCQIIIPHPIRYHVVDIPENLSDNRPMAVSPTNQHSFARPTGTAVSAPAPIKLEDDLAELLDAQAQRLQKKRGYANWFILAVLLAIGGTSYGWYASSPVNQAQVAQIIQNLKEGKKDFALVSDPTKMAEQFDESLAEISTRKDDIDLAAQAMGVDTGNVVEDGMDAEMLDMMGGEGRTVGQRNKLLQQNLGGIAKGQVAKHDKLREQKAAKAEQGSWIDSAAGSIKSVKIPSAQAAATRPVVAPTPSPVVHDAPLVLE